MARAQQLLLLILVLSACGPRFAWHGTWVGQRDLVVPQGADPAAAHTLARIELTIKEGNRFELIEGGMPIEGSVHFRGREAVLKPDTIMGRPIRDAAAGAEQVHRDILLEPQEDGTILYFDGSPVGPPGPIRLERAAQPAP